MKVAFIGHRKIEKTETLMERIAKIVKRLILDENVDTFLFGSRSAFNDICYDIVTRLKDIYPSIRRVYVRAEYQYISQHYHSCLLESYEETFFADQARGAGYRSYIKRNQEMIDMCDVLVVYCDMDYKPMTGKKSGTIRAMLYAQKNKKRIINMWT